MTALQQATRIAIVIEADDTGQLMRFIAAVTTLIGLLLQVGTPVYWFVVDWSEAITFTAKVWSIWFNAFAYGLVGLRR